MKTSVFAFAVLMGIGTMACGGVEGECETLCEWLDDCGSTTGSDCVDECVETYDEADDDCQESFDEFVACLEEDDSCDASSDCAGEASNFLDDCANEFD